MTIAAPVQRIARREHGVKEELRLRGDGNPQEGHVEAFTAAGEVGQRVDDLAQHLGDDETCNREIVAAQMQDGTAEKGRRRAARPAEPQARTIGTP
jgi:hypothetical protein